MKQITKTRILSLLVVFGLLTNCETKNESMPSQKTLTVAKKKASPEEERKKWEASPDGIKYKQWEASPEGKKVHASYDKIMKSLNDFSNMEAVVTSVTFQRENAKTSDQKWLIVNINGEEYMMQFSSKDFEPLKSLKVNDKIIVKSRSAGYSPNHPYLILSGDHIEHNNKVLFKRDISNKNGC